MTAKASTASMRWPATESPSGVGSQMTATRAATASKTPQLARNQVGFAGDGDLGPRGTGYCVDRSHENSPFAAPTEVTVDQLLGGDHLSEIKRR